MTKPAPSASTAPTRESVSAAVEASVTELLRSSRSWIKQLAEHFEPPLPPLAFGMLRHVMAHGPLRSSELVIAFGMDKSAVSRQIAILRDAGLIEASPDPADRRASLLQGSDAARREVDTFGAGIRARYRDVLDSWSVADLDQLAQLLTRLNGDLDLSVEPPR